MPTPSGLYPTREASDFLGSSENTLNGWRSLGIGPAFVKLGGRVFYRKEDLDEWLLSRRVTSTAAARGLQSHRKAARIAERDAEQGAA